MAKTRRDLTHHQSAQELGVYDMDLPAVAEGETPADRRVVHHISWDEQHVKISKSADRLREQGVPESRWWRA